MKRLLVLLVVVACTVQAEIYKSKNDKGEWVYTDKPSPDAERMKLPPLSTYTPAPIKQPPALWALEALDKDRKFLTVGGVFTDDMIDGYIDLKMEEVTRLRMTTHPIEFDMYYSL